MMGKIIDCSTDKEVSISYTFHRTFKEWLISSPTTSAVLRAGLLCGDGYHSGCSNLFYNDGKSEKQVGYVHDIGGVSIFPYIEQKNIIPFRMLRAFRFKWTEKNTPSYCGKLCHCYI